MRADLVVVCLLQADRTEETVPAGNTLEQLEDDVDPRVFILARRSSPRRRLLLDWTCRATPVQ